MTPQPSPTNLSDELDKILDSEPMADVPEDLWDTLYPTWTGLWTDYHGKWDELQASDVFPISDLLSDERLAWLKAAITAAYAEAIRGAVPEEATETKTLGKDYAGYSRGFNAAIDTFTTNLKNQGLL